MFIPSFDVTCANNKEFRIALLYQELFELINNVDWLVGDHIKKVYLINKNLDIRSE